MDRRTRRARRRIASEKWLSKNIILVAVDGGLSSHGWDGGFHEGMRNWLSAYTHGDIPTAGMIMSAIILEMSPADAYGDLAVLAHGALGRLLTSTSSTSLACVGGAVAADLS